MKPSETREKRVKELSERLLTNKKLFTESTGGAVLVDGFDPPVPRRLRLNVKTAHDWLDYGIATRLVTRAALLYVSKEVIQPEPASPPVTSLSMLELSRQLFAASDGIIDDESYEFRLTLALKFALAPVELLKDGISKPELRKLKNAETKFLEVLNGLWPSEAPEDGGPAKGEVGRGYWSAALSEAAADALRDQASRDKDSSSEVTANEIALLTDLLMEGLGITDRAEVESLKTSLRRANRAAAKRTKQ